MAITPRSLDFATLVFVVGTLVAPAQVRVTVEDPGVDQSISRGSIRRPLLGYIPGPQPGQLLPLWGITGSAFVGAPVEIGLTPSILEVSPRHDFALAVAAGSGELSLAILKDGAASVQSIPGGVTGGDRISISPTGASAAIYHEATRAVQLVTGLPGAPAIRASISLAGMAGMVTAMAVSDDAGVVLMATSEGAHGSLFSLRPERGLGSVYPLNQIADITFTEDSHDVLIAGYGSNEVLLVRDVTGSGHIVTLADARDGVSQPVAVAASRDGRRGFAANSGSGTILTMSLTAGRTVSTWCRCNPTRLKPLLGSDVFFAGFSAAGVVAVDGSRNDPLIISITAGAGLMRSIPDGRWGAATEGRR